MKYKSVLQQAGLVAASVLLAFLLAELVLRFIYPAQTHYFVWQPDLQHTFTPDSVIMPGLYSPAKFTINSYGVRTDAEQLKPEGLLFDEPNNRDKIAGSKYYLCLGGSTAECLYLDDEKTWPMQIRRIAGEMNLPFFIGNIGKSGFSTQENYIQLKYCVPQYKKFKGVILMVGLNDLVKRLSRDTLFENDFHFTPAVEDSFVNNIFLKQGRGAGTTWCRRTALFYVFQKALHRYNGVSWGVQDDKGEIYKTWRENRQQAAAIMDTLPDMTAALNEYGRNLNAMIDEAQKQRLEIIFVNQSVLWKDTMAKNELAMLWMGGIGNFQHDRSDAYYSPKALRRGLNLYNQKLAEVCAQRRVLMIDIDSKLPHDLSTFYDDCHFTIAGAQKVGRIIFEGMENKLPEDKLKK